MNILFSLAWLKPGKPPARFFKSTHYLALMEDYMARIARFAPCRMEPLPAAGKTAGSIVWLCARSSSKPILSSEEIAVNLSDLLNSGTKQLLIVIGGASGLSPQEEKKLAANRLWSFGPMTYPHELASVIAAEQLYRAFTILKRQPYHLGH